MPLMNSLGSLKQFLRGEILGPTTYFIDTVTATDTGTGSNDYDRTTNKLTTFVSPDSIVDIDMTTNVVSGNVNFSAYAYNSINTIRVRTTGGVTQKALVDVGGVLTISSTNTSGANNYYATNISGPELINCDIDNTGNKFVIGGYIGASQLPSTSSFPAGNNFSFISKINSNHTLLWQKQYNLTDGAYNHSGGFIDIKIDDTTGDMYVVGNYSNSNNSSVSGYYPSYAIVLKLDNSGSILWQKRFSLNSYFVHKCVVTTNYLYVLMRNPAIPSDNKIYICKMSLADGSIVATKSFSDFILGGYGTLGLDISTDPSDPLKLLYLTYLSNTQDTAGITPANIITLDENLDIGFTNKFGILIGGGSFTINYINKIYNNYGDSAMYVGGLPSRGNIDWRSIVARLPNDGTIPPNGSYTLTSSSGFGSYKTTTITTTTPSITNSTVAGSMESTSYVVTTPIITTTTPTSSVIKTTIG